MTFHILSGGNSPPTVSMTRKEIGAAGEAKALAFLQKKGYRLLEANYRQRFGEIDLVMMDGNTLAFVEVKTRENRYFGMPQEAVTRKKQGRMVKAALAYVKEKNLAGRNLRFDVVAVEPTGVEHIPNAFASTGRYTM